VPSIARRKARARLRAGTLLSLGGVLGLAVAALAAGGQGALTQLPGTSGCIAESPEPTCAQATNLTGQPETIVLSADGRFVYAAAGAGTRIFRRGSSGRLTQLPGTAGCIENTGRRATPGCALVRGVHYAGGVVAIAGDGRTAYASAEADQGALLGPAIVGFHRNPGAGTLTQFDGDPVCIASVRKGKCVAESNVFALDALLSRDGRNVYLPLKGLVATFGRDPSTGALTAPAPDATACIREPIFLPVRARHCATGRALRELSSLVESPDGRFLYATSYAGGIAVLRRTAGGGALEQPPGRAGCVATDPPLRGCAAARGLSRAVAAAISPDGRTLYAVSTRPAPVRLPTSFTLSIFRRNPQTGSLTQLPGKSGCLNNRGDSGCAVARGLLTPKSVAVSPDGRTVYVASTYDFAVAAFSRNRRTGALSQLTGAAGCSSGATPVLLYHPRGCSAARMGRAWSVAVSPDGRHVYVGSEASYGTRGGGGQIGVFARGR
jgi:WD40-like Beta Propeller Repeat